MVGDFSNCYCCNFSFRSKEFYCTKKIGSYFGKLKNTFENFEKEINTVSEEIDVENKIDNKKDIKLERNKKDHE